MIRILAVVAAILTTYLVGRRHRIDGLNHAADPRAPIDDIDWLDDFSPSRDAPQGFYLPADQTPLHMRIVPVGYHLATPQTRRHH